jgi:hypothetical protein
MMKTHKWRLGAFARLRGRAFVAVEGKMRTKTQSVAWRVVLVLAIVAAMSVPCKQVWGAASSPPSPGTSSGSFPGVPFEDAGG